MSGGTWTTVERSAYSKRWRMDEARGCRRWLPAGPAEAVVERLIAAGFSGEAISRAAGTVDGQTIRNLAKHTYPRARRRVVEAVLPLTIASVIAATPPAGEIPAVGTIRRIRALMAIGWTHAEMTRSAGINTNQLSCNRAAVTRATHDRVVDLYDALSMRQGPSPVTRSRAVKLGYAPPLAWDDDTIDDPKAKPYRETKVERRHAYLGVDDIAIERVLAGESIQLTEAERAIAIERLAARGLTDGQIGDRIGVWAETVLRTRRRHGIESRWVA